MTQRKIGKSWYVDFSHHGKRYRMKSPDDSKKGAQAYEATWRKQLADGKRVDEPTDLSKRAQSFESFAWFWFKTHVQVHNKPSMIAKVRYTLNKKLIPYFGKKPLDRISTLDIEEYKAQQASRGLANKTINNELSILGKCLRDAKRWHNLEAMPDIVRLKLPPTQYDFLTTEECHALLSELQGIWFDIVYVALKTGLRRGELQGLRWSDVNLDHQRLTVRHNWCSVQRALLSPKGNRTRTLPLPSDVVHLLRQRPAENEFVFQVRHGVFQAHELAAALNQACNRAGLRKVTLHVFRHTYASHLAMKGVPIAVIQHLLGHTDIKITMRYAHLSQESINDAVRHLEQPFAPRLAA